MALSQTLEDSPAPAGLRAARDAELCAVYNEQHRLALEVLVSGGAESFTEFLVRERLPCFLSAGEVRGILGSADPPVCVPVLEDSGCDHSATVDGSSLTYFPEVSDVEPPLLELGWPAFTAGSFRGVTRAVAHFQPAYGDSIYRCKEAARRMIRSAKEVIAIVTDSLTDLDIFGDLREASSRGVPVYILLDQSSLPEFLQMCRSVHVRLDELRHMRVRTITGSTYYLRSGARISGKVHERFMLIDGNRVATGSYRFNWTDGKLNSSNLIELSGQITESFDEEFRILYAQSLPVSTSTSSSLRSSSIYEHLLLKTPRTPQKRTVRPDLTSTPNTTQNHLQNQNLNSGVSTETEGRRGSDSSTLGEDWPDQEHEQNIAPPEPAEPLVLSPVKAFEDKSPVLLSSVGVMTSPAAQNQHVSTQTSQTQPHSSSSSSSSPSSSPSTTSSSPPPPHENPAPSPPKPRPPLQRTNLRECFCRLAKERQLHYTSIRSKLDHMMLLLSHRRQHAGPGLALSPAHHRAYGGHAHVLMEGVFKGAWPRGLQ